MFRSALVFASLLCLFTVAEVSAATTATTRNPNRKIMPGNHRPVYTRYGHHSLTRGGLFNMFRMNGSGIPRKARFKKSK